MTKETKRTVEERLSYLESRQEILDCIGRYTRALDRHDKELFVSAFHPDATLDYGTIGGKRLAAGPAEIYSVFQRTYVERFTSTLHMIGNHTCEIDGDVAHSETYAYTMALTKDGNRINIGWWRYVDRFERRDGQWRTAARCVVPEALSGLLASLPIPAHGRWDRTDRSYDRPLQVELEAAGSR